MSKEATYFVSNRSSIAQFDSSIHDGFHNNRGEDYKRSNDQEIIRRLWNRHYRVDL